MAFSRAPRHLFQLLPNGKAESADPRIRFDHLWMFVINGVERKRARKRGRHTYYLSSLSPFPHFSSKDIYFDGPFLSQYSCLLSILSQFSRLLSRLEFLIRSFFSESKNKKKEKRKASSTSLFHPVNKHEYSTYIPMNIYERHAKFDEIYLTFYKRFPLTMTMIKGWPICTFDGACVDGMIARISYNTRGDFIIETSWNNISRRRNFANLIWSVSPPSRCVISPYDSLRFSVSSDYYTDCTKKTLYSHPRTREINVRKFIPTVS